MAQKTMESVPSVTMTCILSSIAILSYSAQSDLAESDWEVSDLVFGSIGIESGDIVWIGSRLDGNESCGSGFTGDISVADLTTMKAVAADLVTLSLEEHGYML